MSKSSTVTLRDQPVADVTSESGALRVHAETFTVETEDRIHVVDLTDRVMGLVRKLRIKEGIVNLFSTHTTCTVFINEFQSALLKDIKKFLEGVVARDAEWLHNDPGTPTATA
jgi:secondary thiamine-phosphate synthase enzyme